MKRNWPCFRPVCLRQPVSIKPKLAGNLTEACFGRPDCTHDDMFAEIARRCQELLHQGTRISAAPVESHINRALDRHPIAVSGAEITKAAKSGKLLPPSQQP